MAYVTNDGIRIHYALEGEGTPLVLHHGLATPSTAGATWGVEALRDARRLVLVDSRGRGGSERPRAPGAYGAASRSASAVLASL
ncbi:MAG TPA: hypothetical protein VF912_05050 [Anaeromyxobacter sp.]